MELGSRANVAPHNRGIIVPPSRRAPGGQAAVVCAWLQGASFLGNPCYPRPEGSLASTFDQGHGTFEVGFRNFYYEAESR